MSSAPAAAASDTEPDPDTGSAGREGPRRWDRWLIYLVLAAFVVRVVFVLWESRGWFFTDDDWDYITRSDWGSVLDTHAGHFNLVASGWAYLVRGLVGLDYWPGYALLVALSWPLVGLAAWWVWRRREVDARWAAGGAILLMWLGTAAWIQFGHAGQGVAAAATIVAIHLDEKRLTVRNAALNFLLSLIAAFASSTAGLAAAVRAGFSLIYKRWNGVVAAGAVSLAYVLARLFLTRGGALSSFRTGLKGLTDVVTTVRAGLGALGAGLRAIIPWPLAISWILGLLFIGVAVWLLVAWRLSYFSVALVGGAAAYVGVSLITRFLGRPAKLHQLLANQWDSLTGPRFANLAVTYLIVALVPLLATRVRRRVVPAALIGVCAVLMLGVGVWNTAGSIDAIAQKSAQPKASWPAALVELRSAGEPAFPSGGQPLHPSLSEFFTLDALDYVIEAELMDSLLASDIYRIGDVRHIAESKVRGVLRMNVQSQPRTLGGWADLGISVDDDCRRIEKAESFPVLSATRFELRRINGASVTLRWLDDFGPGVVTVVSSQWSSGKGSVWVEVPGPQPGAVPPELTIESRAVDMCFG